jgi:hypothetical protein
LRLVMVWRKRPSPAVPVVFFRNLRAKIESK